MRAFLLGVRDHLHDGEVVAMMRTNQRCLIYCKNDNYLISGSISECLGELQYYKLFAFVLILWSHGLSALHSQYKVAAGLQHHLDVPAVPVGEAELRDQPPRHL